MKLSLKNLKAKVDQNKLVVDFEHIFQPFGEYPEIKVHCNYLRNGELMKYLDINTGAIDMPRLFVDKVESIEGIELENSDGEPIEVTPQVIADLPVISTEDDPNFLLQRLQALVVSHILKANDLNGDEIKN